MGPNIRKINSGKGFALPAVLIILVVLTGLLINQYRKSSESHSSTRADSVHQAIRVQALSEFEKLRVAFFESVDEALRSQLIGQGQAILSHPAFQDPDYTPIPGVTFEIRCLGQGNENFEAGKCTGDLRASAYPKTFDIKLNLRDPKDPSNTLEVSGYLNIEPEKLSAFSLWLTNSQEPVVYGNGLVKGNVAVSFAPDLDTEQAKIYFMNNEELRFTGSFRIAGANEDEPLVYGAGPGGPLDSPGPVVMQKGHSFDSDFQNANFDEILEGITMTAGCNGVTNECNPADPVGTGVSTVLKRITPQGRFVSQARLKFGEEDGVCKFKFDQTEVFYSMSDTPCPSCDPLLCGASCPPQTIYEWCDSGIYYCYYQETEDVNVWPSSGVPEAIPDMSVVVAQSKDIRVQPLNPGDNIAETCGSAFTVVGNRAGNISFDTSFVDTDLTGSTDDRLKVAFGVIGTPTHQGDTSAAAYLHPETKLKDGKVLGQIYNGMTSSPIIGGDENFEINASLIAFTRSMNSCLEDPSPPDCWDAKNRAIQIGGGMLTSEPASGWGFHFGKLGVTGAELSRSQSQLRRINNDTGETQSGFDQVDRTFIPNIAPGLNSQILVSLISTVTHLELRFKNLDDLLAEYSLDWEPAPGGSSGGTSGGSTGVGSDDIYTFGGEGFGHQTGGGSGGHGIGID